MTYVFPKFLSASKIEKKCRVYNMYSLGSVWSFEMACEQLNQWNNKQQCENSKCWQYFFLDEAPSWAMNMSSYDL